MKMTSIAFDATEGAQKLRQTAGEMVQQGQQFQVQLEALTTGDKQVDALPDGYVKSAVRQAVEFLVPNRHYPHPFAEESRDLSMAAAIQQAAVGVATTMTGASSGKILAAIGLQVLQQFPLGSRPLLEMAFEGAEGKDKDLLRMGEGLGLMGYTGSGKLYNETTETHAVEQLLQHVVDDASVSVGTLKDMVLRTEEADGHDGSAELVGRALAMIMSDSTQGRDVYETHREYHTLNASSSQTRAARTAFIGPYPERSGGYYDAPVGLWPRGYEYAKKLTTIPEA